MIIHVKEFICNSETLYSLTLLPTVYLKCLQLCFIPHDSADKLEVGKETWLTTPGIGYSCLGPLHLVLYSKPKMEGFRQEDLAFSCLVQSRTFQKS